MHECTADRGAVLIIAHSPSLVLLIKQIDHEEPFWKFPGGKIEPGESVRHAARRELWEETGHLLPTKRIIRHVSQHERTLGRYVPHVCTVARTDAEIQQFKSATDFEGTRIITRLFRLNELRRMVDFMPRHRPHLRHLDPAVA